MRKTICSKVLVASFALVALICVSRPAFAQHGGGGHGGGGGGFHGGGGGGGHFSGGGMRGSGPSGRSFSGPGMRSPTGRGPNSGFSGRFNSQRPWGAPSSHSRSFQ